MVRIKITSSTARMVGEFVFIVLGVLSALMVDTWIEQRNDDELRQQYRDRLSTDLETDLRNLDQRISFFTAVHYFGIQVIEWINSDEEIGREGVLAAYYASELWRFLPIKNTYEDLQSTGNMRLLRDIDLRLALAMYYNQISNLEAAVGPAALIRYRQAVRGIIPWEIQAAIKEECPTSDSMNRISTGFQNCLLPDFSQEATNEVFLAIRDHPQIVEIATHRVSEISAMLFLFNVQRESLVELLALL